MSVHFQYHPTQRPSHLGAEGIPGPCPQLVSLGLCHVCSLLSIIQLMLGLAILSQVGAGLLLLEAEAGPWFPLVTNGYHAPRPERSWLLVLPPLFLSPAFLLLGPKVETVLLEVPVCRSPIRPSPGPNRERKQFTLVPSKAVSDPCSSHRHP